MRYLPDGTPLQLLGIHMYIYTLLLMFTADFHLLFFVVASVYS